MFRTVVPRVMALSAALFAAGSARAENAAETALRRFFEGKKVVVLTDMPATSSGIDIYPEREYPMDFAKTGDRVRDAGVALREGDRVAITRLKLKDDLIEFQLAGGGFSSFRDAASTQNTQRTKTSREYDLEKRIKAEKDPQRKRELQQDLDYYRRERESDNDYARQRDAEVNARRKEDDRRRALDMGSRFNIRFEKKDVPAAFKTPEGVMRALEKYVDFGDLGPRPPQTADDLVGQGTAASVIKKGSTRREVEAVYGSPRRQDKSREGALDVTVAAYERGRERLEVTYVDDVAVRVEVLQQKP